MQNATKKGKKKPMIDSDEELEAYKDLIAGSSSDEYGSQAGSESGEEDEAKQNKIEAMR